MDNDEWTYDPMADFTEGIPCYPPGPDDLEAVVFVHGKTEEEAIHLADRICGLLNDNPDTDNTDTEKE